MSMDSVNESDTDFRIDIANSIPGNVLTVKKQPTILDVTEGMKIVVGIVSGLASLLWLVTMIFIGFHRENCVMKLAQWPFLVWLLFCCLLSNLFIFTIMPTWSWHCRVRSFFQFLPLHMIGAILVGRTWRVFVTISGALSIGGKGSKSHASARILMQLLSKLSKVPFCFRTSDKTMNFRATATATETVTLILLLSFPQIFIQFFGLIYYSDGSQEISKEYNKSGDIGRVICSDYGQWVETSGSILTVGIFVLAVLVSWVAVSNSPPNCQDSWRALLCNLTVWFFSFSNILLVS